MSFSFFKASRSRPGPSELARAIKDSLLALDTKTFAKALEEVEKNILSMKHMICGDGETEPNQDQVTQLATEICKEDVLSLFVQKLPSLGWDARKDLAYCWGILLRQQVGSTSICVDYIENHLELLDFLVFCYNNKETALNCGNMLRECIKYPSLAKYVLESTSFELFFKYVELPNFDIASDALATFKDLLTKHETAVSQYLSVHYEEAIGISKLCDKKAILEVSFGIPFGASKFTNNEALHPRSSILEDNDGFVEGKPDE
ncbi:uncharacterized protein A4U43_C07F9040 [Asparagus officinalis]|uniref:Uncharacterized protein n=1 Tax=Asparagus officinalis TaxID=4686 RepID=A0A5P1EAH1_ASPOF|nr:uncharacterized protein A4U43_C07F9040 [Asparagus officinalis]